MKKALRSQRQRRHAQRREAYELAQRATHRVRLLRRANVVPAPSRDIGRRARQYKVLEAPKQFSLVDNPNEVLAYFDDAGRYLRAKQPINFDLSKVETVTPDAIAFMVALVNDQKFRHGTNVSGNAPKNALAARMFDQSGFYDHVQTKRIVLSKGGNRLVHRITENRVENIEAMNLAKVAVAHVWGDNRRVPQIYEVLIECMANTNNHAALSNRGAYNWWAFVYNDPDSKRTVFTFLDLGVGVFRSIQRDNIWRPILASLGLSNDLAVAEGLFAGRIRSSTGRKERGKGFPRIYQRARSGKFSNFVMIANNVYADLISGRRDFLPRPLDGTLFCFEIKLPEASTP